MLSNKNILSKPILLCLLIVWLGIAIFWRPTHHYLTIMEGIQWITLVTKSLLIFLIAAISSLVFCYLLIKTNHIHGKFSNDHVGSGPQKTHNQATPRIGGLAILAGLFTALYAETLLMPDSPILDDDLLIFAAIPAFMGGLIEDVTKNVGTAQRLLLSMISAAIVIWLFGSVISRTDIPILDYALGWLPFAALFTVFAVSGVSNAINIIDGYNGLASGLSVIALIAIAIVASLVNDQPVFIISLSVAGATLGFFVWNWPKGKIFLGDSGAYLLGFMLAELSVLLVYRNPSVSPWFPLLLLAYPIFETLSSIYRRKFIFKSGCDQPDALHLHHLISNKLVCNDIKMDDNSAQSAFCTRNNSRVAPYIWATAILSAIFAILFWDNTSVLMLATLAGCLIYNYIYKQLTKFQLLGLIRFVKRKL